MSTSQEAVIPVPTTGKDRRGKTAPLEGPAVPSVNPGSETYITAELDPADPTGSTVIIKSIVDTNTPGEPPYAATAKISRDARVGTEVVLVHEEVAVEITSGEATGFGMTLQVGEIREQP